MKQIRYPGSAGSLKCTCSCTLYTSCIYMYTHFGGYLFFRIRKCAIVNIQPPKNTPKATPSDITMSRPEMNASGTIHALILNLVGFG